MSLYKRNKTWWWNFWFQGVHYRESSHQTNKDRARDMEAKRRGDLAAGTVGIRDKVPAPTLKAFLESDYRTFMEETHKAKRNTVLYYDRGIKLLVKSELANVPLDEITTQHGARFAASLATYSPAGINCGLRVLSIALKLAVEWGKLTFAPKIKMQSETKTVRKRVLSSDEQAAYLAACSGVWKIIATVMLGTGMRPGEVRRLTWERVDFSTNVLDIDEGKSKNAERRLPMLPAVLDALKTQWEAAGRPQNGWVFSSPVAGKTSHLAQAYDAHEQAIKTAGLEYFVPYTMRHTALTMLAAAGVDVFTLKTIAGHGNIRMTQRYVHPQDDSVRAAFERLAAHKTGHNPNATHRPTLVKPAA